MRKQLLRAVLVVAVMACIPAVASAQYTSPSYRINETFIGSGGELEACGTLFCSRQAAGETTVGNTTGNDFQAQGGFNTANEELLEVTVTGGNFSFGFLDDTLTRSLSTTFDVRNYLSNGYVVKIAGTPPSLPSGQHTLAASATAVASSFGTEQFGINLRANTDPPIGADPLQVPDNTFSFGTYATDYGIIDQFKYIDGDTIAFSNVSSGKTIYTISFIANISRNTPAGVYSGRYNIIVVPTF